MPFRVGANRTHVKQRPLPHGRGSVQESGRLYQFRPQAHGHSVENFSRRSAGAETAN
jgi:hypothetical protein